MKTLIIGGGLSGLALADALETQGRDYLLVEARQRFGGRIMTNYYEAGYFDMGPAWFWSGQPRIHSLVERLGLKKFEQFADGIFSFEDEHGQIQRGRGFSPMEGSWRLVDGLGVLTQALAERLPDERKRLNSVVTKLERTDDGIIATFSNGHQIEAGNVVLALPLRIAAEITFSPILPEQTIAIMRGTATWMAGQAKAVAVYDTPFWRDEGLSGDAMSRKGPMVEMHDASPCEGGPYALFGFIGVPPEGRKDVQQLQQHIKAQLVRIFGPNAAEPTALYIKDWAFDPHTSIEADKAPLYTHPNYGMPHMNSKYWGNFLHFAGTETAPQFGGYIEGALEAAETH